MLWKFIIKSPRHLLDFKRYVPTAKKKKRFYLGCILCDWHLFRFSICCTSAGVDQRFDFVDFHCLQKRQSIECNVVIIPTAARSRRTTTHHVKFLGLILGCRKKYVAVGKQGAFATVSSGLFMSVSALCTALHSSTCNEMPTFKV